MTNPAVALIGATSLAHVAGIGRPLDTRELKSAFSIMDNVVEQVILTIESARWASKPKCWWMGK